MVVWTWIFCFMGNSKNTTKKGPSTGRLASNGEVERKIKVRITLPFPSSFQIFFSFFYSRLGASFHIYFFLFSLTGFYFFWENIFRCRQVITERGVW